MVNSQNPLFRSSNFKLSIEKMTKPNPVWRNTFRFSMRFKGAIVAQYFRNFFTLQGFSLCRVSGQHNGRISTVAILTIFHSDR